MSWKLSSTSCCRKRCTSRMERLRGSSASRIAVPIAPHQAYSSGTKSCSARQRERLAQRPHHAGILRHRADQRHRRLHRPPLDHRTLEIARHRIAQPAQNLGRRIALLLRVDHVALGEHAAASRDPRRATRTAHQVAHLFHRVLHAQRLLIQERPGAGRALARAVVILNPAVLQADVLGTLAAQFEHRAHLRDTRCRSCARSP